MNLLDLYEGREPYQQAIDKLEHRRIEDLEARMDDCARRGDVEGFRKAKEERDSYHKVNEAGIGQDIVNKTEKMARATPPSKAGAVASTVKNAAKWLAGKGGPGKEGPTYEGKDDAWSQEGEWKKIPKSKSGKPVDPRGEVTHLSDVARREAERKAAQKKNSEKVEEDKPRDLAAAVMLKKAHAAFPLAKDDAEALALWIAEKEQRDVNRLERENEHEEEMIARIADQLKKKEINELSPATLKSYADKRGAQVSAMKADNPDPVPGSKEWVKQAIPAQQVSRAKQKIARAERQQGVEEGWQDFNKIEPYAVCLAGKPVKEFDYYEEARRFHDNWKAKLYREGNTEKADKITLIPIMKEDDPDGGATIAIGQPDGAPADLEEHGGGGGGPRQWHAYVRSHRANEAANPAQQAAIAIAMKKAGRKPKQVDEAGTAGLEDTIRRLMAPAYEEETGGWFGYTLEKKAPTMARLRDEYSDDLNDIFYNATPEELHQAAQELKDMYGQVAESKETVFRSHDIEVEYPEGKGHSHVYHRREPYRLSSIFSDANSVASRNRRAKISLFVDGEYVPNDVWQELDEAQAGDVNFGHTVTRGGWIAFDPKTKQIKKRFKTHTAGKSYAQTHGLGFASSEHYFDRVKEPVEETVTDVRAGMAKIYNKLAPKIERYKDSFLANQLYDELEAYAELHGAENEFKRMMNGARNRAHMEYDTNPGGFQNWFWFLPFGDEVSEEKTRLDPKCWKGKKIGTPKTKMKGGVRVNNCVPAESVEEEAKKGLYYYVNKRKKAGTSRDKDDPRAPSAQDWKDAAKTAKKESVEEEWSEKYKRSIDCSHPKGFSQKAHCAGRKKNEGMFSTLGEDQDTSGVESAIIRRILVAHKDWLMKFGPQKVMQAAEEVAYNVGDVDEIGTSDISAYVHEVGQILGA